MSGNPLLEAALAYVARGWAVFPLHTPLVDGAEMRCSCGKPKCDRIGKHPRTRHGLDDASTDPEVIKEWWRSCPDANIGIATGAISGIFVVDIDSYKGGDESLSRLEEQNGKLPDTLTASTGGGGKHLYFQYPGRSVRSVAGFCNEIGIRGIDIRGDGGYVVGVPGFHWKRGQYFWIVADAEIAVASDWLLAKLTTAKAKRQRHIAGDKQGTEETGPVFGREVVIAKLRDLRNPESRTLMQRVLDGKPFAVQGQRDMILQRIASILAFVAPDNPPEDLADILGPSLDVMEAENDDPDNPAPSLDDATEKIERAQLDARNQRATEKAVQEELCRAILAKASRSNNDRSRK